MTKRLDSGDQPGGEPTRADELARAWAVWPGRLQSLDSHTTELMWFAFQAGFDAGAQRRGQSETRPPRSDAR